MAFNGRSSRPGAEMTPETGSLEQVDRGEEGDPDNVDEVPVVRGHDGADGLGMRVAPGGEGPGDDEQEGDEPARDVHAVEPGGQEEDRAVAVGRERDALTGELGVLVDLAADEERAEQVRQDVPLAHSPFLDLPD